MKRLLLCFSALILAVSLSACTKINYPENNGYTPVTLTTAPVAEVTPEAEAPNEQLAPPETQAPTTTEAEQTNVVESLTPVTTINEADIETHLVDTADGSVRFMGRTLYSRTLGMTYFDYTCSGFEFTCTARKVEAYFTSGTDYSKESKQVWLAVYINDSDLMYKRFPLDKQEGWYTLFESESPEDVKIKVIRLTEIGGSKAMVSSLRVEGLNNVTPTTAKERKIEFVGDSITCGYGIETLNPQDGFKSTQQNGMITFAALTAKHFNAEFNCVSCSGMGVYSSYTENGARNDYSLMTDLYRYTDLTVSRNSTAEWDTSRFEPDVIVLNGGTNDVTYVKYDPETRKQEFANAYYNLAVQILTAHPNAKLICCVGTIDYLLNDTTSVVVQMLRNNGYDANFLSFGKITSEEGMGGDYHPSWLTHERMAAELIAEMERLGIY